MSTETFSTTVLFAAVRISPHSLGISIFVCVYSDILLIQFHPPETLRSAGWICEDDSDHSREPQH